MKNSYVLFLCGIGIGSAGCAQTPISLAPATPSASASVNNDREALVGRSDMHFLQPKAAPDSAQDVLDNISFAIKNGYLVQRNFFDQSQLIKFIGGDALFWLVQSQDEQSGIVRFKSGENTRLSIGVEFAFHQFRDKSSGRVGGVKSSIAFNPVPEMQIRLVDIEKSFGKDHSNVDTYSDASYTHGEGWPVLRATDPMGNKTIVYASRMGDGTLNKVVVRFSSDGLVNSIIANQEETK